MFDAIWLRGLGEAGLAQLLTRRPEAMIPPPTSLVGLAARLGQPATVVPAMRRLDRPTLQVGEALAALGVRTDRAALVEMMGADATEDVDRAVDSLVAVGLVEIDQAGRLCLAEAAGSAWQSPLNLGPPAATMLLHHSDEELAAMLRHHRGPARVARHALAATFIEALGDAAGVRKIVAEAPPVLAEILQVAAMQAPLIPVQTVIPAEHPIRWAVERGLLLRLDRWQPHLIMPAEVCLALRPADYRAPFDPQPPHCDRFDVDPAVVERDATAHAGDFLRLVTAILDEAGQKSIARLRGGGIGTRELKRLAKAHGARVADVRLALAVSHAGGLLSMFFGAPTEEYDDWLRLEPASRLAVLLRTWWMLGDAASIDDDGWLPDQDRSGDDVRFALFQVVAQQPAQAIGKPDELFALLDWTRPALTGSAELTRSLAAATWDEAHALGLMGTGALSTAGMTLLADSGEGESGTGVDALVEALAGVGSTVRQTHLQADLTALVPGMPTPGLAALLDSAADRESRGTASVWRFSPSSVRRALDAGESAEALLAALSEVAAAGVPQTLEYLIHDVKRRHGRVRIQAVACCLRSDDTSLLAEIAGDSKLRPLGLRLLAPTIAASMKPLDETLAALRKAGYSPMAEAKDGTAIIERPPTQRAQATPREWRAINAVFGPAAAARRRAWTAAKPTAQTVALVKDLLSRPAGAERPAPKQATRRPVEQHPSLEFDD